MAPVSTAGAATVDTAARRSRAAAPRLRSLVLVALVVGLLLTARSLVAEPFAIPSESMQPTLRAGDQVLVDKLSYRLGAPARDDLAAFTAADGNVQLKRIVGLPGDSVGIEDGVLVVNGRPRREAYVDHSRVDSVYFGPVTVPANRFFVLGDNRGASRDSRDYGTVARRDMIGRVALRLWPVSR